MTSTMPCEISLNGNYLKEDISKQGTRVVRIKNAVREDNVYSSCGSREKLKYGNYSKL